MLKAYIKTHEFDLPMNHHDLIQKIKETVYEGEELLLSKVGKMNPITKIEGNDYLKVEKQKTNIFLLNFLLLVFEKENKNINDEIFCVDSNIIAELNKLTNLNLDLDFEKTERSLIELLNKEETTLPFISEEDLPVSEEDLPVSEEDSPSIPNIEEPTTKQTKEDNILNNVTFSMEWVKKAHSKIQAAAYSKEKEE